MRIAIIGTGYVGLVSGVCFAEIGHDVVCVDNNTNKLKLLESGKLPVYEPCLDELMLRNQSAGRLTFTSDLSAAVRSAEAVFIAVGTPTRRRGGSADLTYLYSAVTEIATALDGYTVVVTKSTVPVGTNRQVRELIAKIRPEASFDVVSNPEFLREGAAVDDFMQPDRIVVGVETDPAAEVMRTVYAPLVRKGHPLLEHDLESAEMIKYAANAFLATKITFINEMAELCESVGADVRAVAHGMGLDSRVGGRFLNAGPGFGGSCFPKDTRALARSAQSNGVTMRIVDAVINANDHVKRRMIDRLHDLYPEGLEGKRVAILGVTFKADTDDMREAPSLTIVPALVGYGANVRVRDPQGVHEGRRLLPGVSWHDTAYGAAAEADLVVVLTEWREFVEIDLAKLAGAMRTPRLADFRNLYSRERARAAGFGAYVGVGVSGYLPANEPAASVLPIAV